MSTNKLEIKPVGNGLRALVFMGLGVLSIIIGLIALVVTLIVKSSKK